MKKIKEYFDIYNIIIVSIFISGLIVIFCDIDIIIDYLNFVILFNFILIIIKIVITSIKKQTKLSKIPKILFFIYAIFYLLGFYFSSTYTEKPIIYIYPEEKTDLNLKLSNDDMIINTYPKYQNGWDINVDENGNIYDKKTNRNYYALYYDLKDNSKIDESVGFIVNRKNIVKFLEEKLKYIGLNEREINEFIIYWLPQLNKNEYNYIYFRTTDEINDYFKIITNKKPDTLIRVYMDFKKVNGNKKVAKQSLPHIERKGFTIVEWGGRNLNKGLLK